MLYKFPTPFVFYTQVKNYKEINASLLEDIEQRRGGEEGGWQLCDTITSVYNSTEYNSFLRKSDYVENIVWDPLEQMLRETLPIMGDEFKYPVSSSISNCWYNIYNKGSFQEIHNHMGQIVRNGQYMSMPSYSMAYIAKLEGKNTTVFTERREALGLFGGARLNFDTSRMDDIGEGTVIIFPYYLDHYVLPSPMEGRITVTYNISSDYQL